MTNNDRSVLLRHATSRIDEHGQPVYVPCQCPRCEGVREHSEVWSTRANDPTVVIDENGLQVAKFVSPDDAHLAAAAPKLYSAAVWALIALDRWYSLLGDVGVLGKHPAREALRAAIREAAKTEPAKPDADTPAAFQALSDVFARAGIPHPEPEYLAVPGFSRWHSGGGCMALRKVLPNGAYILIT